MCKSHAEGGKRCASDTRPGFSSAVAQVAAMGSEGARNDVRARVTDSVVSHAATRSGAKEVAALREQAARDGDVAQQWWLQHCEDRGAQQREVDELIERKLRERKGAREAAQSGGRFAQLSRSLMVQAPRTFGMSPDPTDPAFPGRAPSVCRSWDEPDPSYSPNAYVTPKIAKRINAGGEKNVDPTWHERWESEVQWADGALPRLASPGVPLNPAGRTGLTGLGGCKRLGENKAADPIITRDDPATGKKQILLGYKETEQQWALPGGTVDEGEDPADACSRELLEEVGLSVDMRAGRVVYQGFVDDHRNTDNAWFATQARHVHLSGAAAAQEPDASDDIAAARWVDVDSVRPEDLFASHGPIVREAGLLG